MKKSSLFTTFLVGATVPAFFVPCTVSCINNNCNISVLNKGDFKISQKTLIKGEKNKILIEDNNANESITGVKIFTDSGLEIDHNDWEYSIKDKKTILIVLFENAVTQSINIELKTKEEEDIYDQFVIVTQGVTTTTTQLLEGKTETIQFRCTSPSKVVDSIDRVNTHPGEMDTKFYTFNYEEQTLTIQGEANHSENKKISVNLNVVNKVHPISVSCHDVDVTSSQKEVTNRGALDTTLTIARAYQQDYQIIDVVVKVGEEILTTSQYTWLVDDFYNYKATVSTNEGIQVKGDVQLIVYVEEKTTNLFNVFITDGSVVEESPKMASQIAGLSQDIYNTIPDTSYSLEKPISVFAKNPSTGSETEIDSRYFYFDREHEKVIIQPEGVKGDIYIRKNIVSNKNFQDISWENLCHFANGGLDVVKLLFSNWNISTFIGQEKDLDFQVNQNDSSNETIKQRVRVIGENHDILSDDKDKKASLTFEFIKLFTPNKDKSAYKIQFDTNTEEPVNCWFNSNTGKSASIREFLNTKNDVFFGGLPKPIQQSAKNILKRRVCDRSRQSKRQDTEDQIFLLTPCEVCGNPGQSNLYPEGEGTYQNIQYEWYSQQIQPITDAPTNARKKTGLKDGASATSYWLSSMCSSDSKKTIYVDGTGKIMAQTCTNRIEISPCFCI